MPLPKADVVLRGGPVWCGLAAGTREALAVWAGRVLATGTADEIEPLIGPDTRVVELRGRAAVPGFNDAHLHLLTLGMTLTEIDLRPSEAPSLDALLARVRERAGRTAAGSWVLGRGYDHFRLDVRRHPLRAELDAAAPGHPVVVQRTCGHVAVANSRALALAGIGAGTPDPPGGAIERRDGELTGLVAERAMLAVYAAAPRPTLDDLVAAIEAAGRLCLSRGITSVMEAALGNRAGFDEWHAYRAARAARRLPVRTYLCLYGDPDGIFERAVEAGLGPGVGDAWLRFGAVKLFTDGSAGARTAAMREPYLGGGDGILCFADEDLIEAVRAVHARGYQLAAHAIGDRAIERTLRAIERADADSPVLGRRHRIEHLGFATPDQVARMARLGMTTGTQPVFMHDFGELYAQNLGEERAHRAYPMRFWSEAGLMPAASTDAPVCDTDPFANLYAMITRRTADGTVMGGQERLTLPEALSAYSLNGAHAEFAERRKGTLEPGKLADIAVLSRDIFRAEPEAIRDDVVCDLTIQGGRIVHDRQGEFSS